MKKTNIDNAINSNIIDLYDNKAEDMYDNVVYKTEQNTHFIFNKGKHTKLVPVDNCYGKKFKARRIDKIKYENIRGMRAKNLLLVWGDKLYHPSFIIPENINGREYFLLSDKGVEI